MRPKEVIQKWVEAFNEGNAEKLAEFYHEEAINHQVTNQPVVGKTAIHKMFEGEFNQADMNCIIENIFEDNDWGILEWIKLPDGHHHIYHCYHTVWPLVPFQPGAI